MGMEQIELIILPLLSGFPLRNRFARGIKIRMNSASAFRKGIVRYDVETESSVQECCAAGAEAGTNTPSSRAICA